ncbi:DNA polymerase III subunit epsilon [Thiohalomonas denitrificans]|uniref:DNA polymerase III subunit epsilon n=1 Tax=Thiohalomonas denitrificans TaxID=415747 RepID=A0A1G5QNW4_9GAMM|nr:DNA polymerase III subunit epsilon [Thiohalomonas denitrificans]SCZ63534.1 DNA polymerase-3 subunit epsilon [Thiohalomonas denitrificans]
MRQIVLDTETTGLEYRDGHRIIEIGCVELLNRRLTGNNYHIYLQPDRLIDSGAMEVHGITNEFLADKPRFKDIVEDFLAYIQSAELVIHNAPFDVGFINNELTLLGRTSGGVGKLCSVLDTLLLARRLHPGQKNNLDALCKRYGIDNTRRDLHGALLDAEILADVYLGMTGGQTALSLGSGTAGTDSSAEVGIRRVTAERPTLKVVRATDDERTAHQAALAAVEKAGGSCVWKELEQPELTEA